MSKNSETFYPLFCHSQDLLLDKVLRMKGDSLFCCFKNWCCCLDDGCSKVRTCFIKLLFLIVSLLINTQFCCNEVVVIASGSTKTAKRHNAVIFRLLTVFGPFETLQHFYSYFNRYNLAEGSKVPGTGWALKQFLPAFTKLILLSWFLIVPKTGQP